MVFDCMLNESNFLDSFSRSFLAGWPGLPHNENHETWLARIGFGVSFLTKLPISVALDMATSIMTYSLSTADLLQSVTPIFGEPKSYAYKRNNDRVGDVAAKEEAMRMIKESKVTEEVPVSFDESKGEKVTSSVTAKQTPPIPAAADPVIEKVQLQEKVQIKATD